jgi:hypothetical protein
VLPREPVRDRQLSDNPLSPTAANRIGAPRLVFRASGRVAGRARPDFETTASDSDLDQPLPRPLFPVDKNNCEEGAERAEVRPGEQIA